MATDAYIVDPRIAGQGTPQERDSEAIAALHRRVTNLEAVRTALGEGAVDAVVLQDGTITTNLIQVGAIQAGSIQAGSITAGHIQANAIEASHISANAITAGDISANAVTAGTIAANAVSAGTIAANAVTATTIQTGAVTAEKISVGTLSTITTNMGSMTAGTITGGTLQTNTSGARVVMDSAGLRGYALDGVTKVFEINAGSGIATFTGIANLDPTSVIPGAALPDIGSGNLFENSTGGNGTTGWLPFTSTLTFDATVSRAPWSGSFKLVATGSGSPYFHNDYTNPAGAVAAEPGQTFTASAWQRTAQVGDTAQAELRFFNAANALQGSATASGYTALTQNVWGRRSVTAVAPAGTTKVRALFYFQTAATNDQFWVQGPQIEDGEMATGFSPRPDEILPDSITAVEIAAGSIATSELADLAVSTAKIVADAITSVQIADDAVTAAQIAVNAITTSEIADNAVTASEIAAGAVTAAEIANNTITAAQVAAATLTGTQIAAATIAAGNIVSGTITATQLAANSVTATQINAGAVTAAKILANTITANEIAADAITATEIAANAVTAVKILANTITASQIAANTITASQIAATTITAAQIAANTITAGKIAANTITAAEIAADAITVSELAANAVTAAKIVANTITASQIAVATITATELAANSVTASEISTGAIQANHVSAGAITAGSLSVQWGGSNMLPNAGFGYATFAGYWGAANGTLTSTTTNFLSGARGARHQVTTTSTDSGVQTAGTHNVLPNKAYTLSTWANKVTAGSRTCSLLINWLTSADVFISQTRVDTSVTNVWQRFSATGTSPSNAAKATIYPFYLIGAQAVSGEQFYVDDVQFEPGEIASAWAPMVGEVLPGSVGNTHIAPDAITTDKIFTGTILAGDIATNAINATHITGINLSVISAAVSSLSAITANMGTLTAGSITGGTITGVTITGGTIQTAAPGTDRIQMTSVGLQNVLADNSTIPVQISSATGVDLLSGLSSNPPAGRRLRWLAGGVPAGEVYTYRFSNDTSSLVIGHAESTTKRSNASLLALDQAGVIQARLDVTRDPGSAPNVSRITAVAGASSVTILDSAGNSDFLTAADLPAPPDNPNTDNGSFNLSFSGAYYSNTPAISHSLGTSPAGVWFSVHDIGYAVRLVSWNGSTFYPEGFTTALNAVTSTITIDWYAVA